MNLILKSKTQKSKWERKCKQFFLSIMAIVRIYLTKRLFNLFKNDRRFCHIYWICELLVWLYVSRKIKDISNSRTVYRMTWKTTVDRKAKVSTFVRKPAALGLNRPVAKFSLVSFPLFYVFFFYS